MLEKCYRMMCQYIQTKYINPYSCITLLCITASSFGPNNTSFIAARVWLVLKYSFTYDNVVWSSPKCLT